LMLEPGCVEGEMVEAGRSKRSQRGDERKGGKREVKQFSIDDVGAPSVGRFSRGRLHLRGSRTLYDGAFKRGDMGRGKGGRAYGGGKRGRPVIFSSLSNEGRGLLAREDCIDPRQAFTGLV